ncbi:MAG: FAD-dependent oxidoreductase [Myxococcota bacterium]|jgi:thioredoxin reductase|nr:FAD-dependent oxidoreductase [Myxococcota bacterium]
MARIMIVGDGPGGLSAALLLAKNGQDVHVFGTDETPMHKAMLYNYLGIKEITGSDFQKVAREQVESFGASLHDARVASLERGEDSIFLSTEDGASFEGDFLVLAMAQKPLFASIGLGAEPEVDRFGRSSIERVYVVGWPVRKQKIQAIISAGDGAAVALAILSEVEGKDTHDFDVV